MKPDARRAFGSAPLSGQRFETRQPLELPATLHADGLAPCPVVVADLTPRGCRLSVSNEPPVAAHVALVFAGGTLISGRVAWNDGAGLGVDFCAPLLPRVVEKLMR